MAQTAAALGVQLKAVPAMDVVGVRARIAVRDIGRLFEEAGRKVRGEPTGAPIGIYYDMIFDPEATDVEIVFPVSSGAEETLLPERVAAMRHHGPYDRIGEAYALLNAWMAEHGLRQDGPVREVYLVGPESGADPAHFVTEVQIPARREEVGGPWA